MTEQHAQSPEPDERDQQPEPRVVVVGPDGMAVESAPGDGEADERSVTELVEQPAKVMRIGSMIKQLLEEVRAAPSTRPAGSGSRRSTRSSIKELEEGLAPELVEELERLSLPFTDDTLPTEAELRIAQAQLVGWLEGLFHGIQTALFAQQMAARAQLEQMRRGPCRAASRSPAAPAPARTAPPARTPASTSNPCSRSELITDP